MKKDYNKLRWQLCEKCLAENNTTAVRESGTYCGGNGDTIPFDSDILINMAMKDNERWYNPAVTVRANQPMFAMNYQICKVCPYELEHWLFYDVLEKEKNENKV